MSIRTAEAVWEGSLKEGKGVMRLGSGAFEGNYSHSSRFDEAPGTNPEELIGAAHAGCYSMAFSGDLDKAGFTPTRVHTTAKVTFERVDGKATITRIHLDTQAEVPGIDEQTFQEVAEGARTGCPVSRSLAGGPEITLTARLV